MKLNGALLMLCVAFMIAAPCVTVNAGNDRMCWGETGWSTDSGDSGQDCGICDLEGTHSQSRSLGTCVDWCFISCYMGQHYTTRSQTVTQNEVSPAQMIICEEEYDEDMNDADLAKDVCMIAALLCGPLPAIIICEIACLVAHEISEAAAMCIRNECKYSCSVSAWNYGGATQGCP